MAKVLYLPLPLPTSEFGPGTAAFRRHLVCPFRTVGGFGGHRWAALGALCVSLSTAAWCEEIETGEKREGGEVKQAIKRTF